jgi:hypothetical protein
MPELVYDGAGSFFLMATKGETMHKEIVVGTDDEIILAATSIALGRARLPDVAIEPVRAERRHSPIPRSFDRIYFGSIDVMRAATCLRNTCCSAAWLGIKEGVVKKPDGCWYDIASIQALGRSGRILFAWTFPVQREPKTDFRSQIVEQGVIAVLRLPTHYSHRSKVAGGPNWRQYLITDAITFVLKDAKNLGWFR